MSWHRPLRKALVAPLLTLLAAACAVIGGDQPAATAPVTATAFDSAWSEYTERKRALGLQPGCEPLRVDPPPGVSYRGTIVWLHGFSACPRQFTDIAPALAEQGFRTLVMLLPGHGLAPRNGDGHPYIGALSTPGTWERDYRRLAQEVNAIMRLVEGERAIGGLSVGATAALFVQLQAPALYRRHIALTPYFSSAASALPQAAVKVSSRIPVLKELPIHWLLDQERCYEKQRQGRGGFCRYRLEHLGALQALGNAVLDKLAEQPLDGPLQLLGKQNDEVANNGKTLHFIELLRGTEVHVCFFPPEIPHALISLWDNVEALPHWREELYAGIARFLQTSEPYPVAGNIQVRGSTLPRCRIESPAAATQ